MLASHGFTGCENGCVNDYYTTKYERPILDPQNDVTFVAANKGLKTFFN